MRVVPLSPLASVNRSRHKVGRAGSRSAENVPRDHGVRGGGVEPLEGPVTEIRAKDAGVRNRFGDEERARAIEWAASLVERALQEEAEERLTLAEAAARSGYSQDHLARLIREGRLPNAGRPHAPRIRAADLPRRSPQQNVVASQGPRAYDPVADARAIGSRR